jgi:hypothetical protein
MSIYVLKDRDARVRFSESCATRLDDLTAEEAAIYCLISIKDDCLAAASSLLDRLKLVDSGSLNHSLARKVASLTAALWTSREYANSCISDTQRGLLRSLFGVCNVRHHLIDSIRKSIPKSKLASYQRLAPRSGKVFLCMRKTFWSDGVKSREHETGAKIRKAFNNVGWQTESVSTQELANIKRDIHCAHNIVIIDAQSTDASSNTLQVLHTLKHSGFLVVSWFMDPHFLYQEDTVPKFDDVSDVVWTGDICECPPMKLSAALTDFPFPVGFHTEFIDLQNQGMSEISFPQFVGGIERNNVSRVIYWVESSDFIAFDFSSHLNDGLDADQSYAMYLRRIMRSPVLVNFALRELGVGVVTHRAFEALAANRLLVQEDCSGIHRYFVEGEHFFSFGGPEQLIGLTQDLMADMSLIKETARKAQRFYKIQYSDHAFVGHFEALSRLLGK